MANGSIWLDSSKAWEGQIEWSSEINIAGNYSEVYVKATMWKTDGYLTSSNSSTSGTITVNGSSYGLTGYQEFKEEVCIFERTIRIYHESDGTKSIDISLTCKGQANTSLASATLSGSGTAVLDQIPRTSTLSAESGTLGKEQTLTIDKASNNLTHTIEYSCGNVSGTIVNKTTAASVKWTPPFDLASANPTGASVTVTLTLTTYSGSVAVGTHSINVFYSIGNEIAPTFTVEFSDAAGYKDIYGDFIQLRSKLNIKVNPTTFYGATVKTCKINVNGETFTDLEAVASEIDLFGDIHVYVLVQDSRGKVAQDHFYVYFRQYSLPTVSSLTVKRCNSDGTSNDQGEFVQVTYSANATPLDSLNTVSYQLEYKKSTDSAFTVVKLPQFTNVFYVNQETYRFAADTGSSYNIRFTVTDAFGSTVKTTVASTAATIMHFKADGHGIGLGKVSEVKDAVDVGWDIQMNGKKIMGIGDPVGETDAVPKGYLEQYVNSHIPEQEETKTDFDKIWPVGSIYISATSTSPAELFGGEWSRIKDRFLLAAGSKYSLGSTGGEATVTLTIDQIPAHTHGNVRRYNEGSHSGNVSTGASSGSDSTDSYTDSTGGGQAHNNMPPYLAVYVWMRTA